MAFVKLKNPKGEVVCIPGSAVKSYENLGFYSEGQEENAVMEDPDVDNGKSDEDGQEFAEVSDSSEEKDEDDIFVNSIQKKPLSSWNKEEVKRYATIFDIDLTGTKSANEAKERIKAFMKNAE